MSIDPVSISAIIIAIIGALGVFINRTHLSHIICCKCIESDCKNNNNDNDNNNNNNNNINDNNNIIESIKNNTPVLNKKIIITNV